MFLIIEESIHFSNLLGLLLQPSALAEKFFVVVVLVQIASHIIEGFILYFVGI